MTICPSGKTANAVKEVSYLIGIGGKWVRIGKDPFVIDFSFSRVH
jgi:hypothetical protein